MTIQLRAALATLGILATCTLGGFAVVQLLAAIPSVWYPWIGISMLITVAISVVYSITLARLRFEASIKEMFDQK